jgi:hypothetical protein
VSGIVPAYTKYPMPLMDKNMDMILVLFRNIRCSLNFFQLTVSPNNYIHILNITCIFGIFSTRVVSRIVTGTSEIFHASIGNKNEYGFSSI